MSPFDRVVFLVCADTVLTHQLIGRLMAGGVPYQLPLAASVLQARKAIRRVMPVVVLLDETALSMEMVGETLESAAGLLAESAPVVVVAAPERQGDLAFLITSGAVDFVARAGDFVPVATGLLERRVRLAEQAEAALRLPPAELAQDFGEVLRHEVNNPLTGILGNAELLLAECKNKGADALPAASAIPRLETIAELAVRLRETIRRLSNAWEARQEQPRSA